MQPQPLLLVLCWHTTTIQPDCVDVYRLQDVAFDSLTLNVLMDTV